MGRFDHVTDERLGRTDQARLGQVRFKGFQGLFLVLFEGEHVSAL